MADTYDSTDGLQDDGVVLGCNFTVPNTGDHHRLSILSSSLGVQNFYPAGYCMWKGLAGGKDGPCRNHPDSVAGQAPPLLDGKPMEGPGWSWTMRPRVSSQAMVHLNLPQLVMTNVQTLSDRLFVITAARGVAEHHGHP